MHYRLSSVNFASIYHRQLDVIFFLSHIRIYLPKHLANKGKETILYLFKDQNDIHCYYSPKPFFCLSPKLTSLKTILICIFTMSLNTVLQSTATFVVNPSTCFYCFTDKLMFLISLLAIYVFREKFLGKN